MHTHFFDLEYGRKKREEGERVHGINVYEKYEGLTIEKRVENMNDSGIDKAVLLCLEEPFLGYTMRLAKEAKEKFPGRFVIFGYINPLRDNPDKVDLLANEGFVGLKMYAGMGYYPGDEICYPIYERAIKHKMPIYYHCGVAFTHSTVLSEYSLPIKLEKAVKTFPELTFIGAHLGVPFYAEMYAMLRFLPNLYTDICGGLAWRFPDKREILKRVIQDIPDKILFGTDADYSIPLTEDVNVVTHDVNVVTHWERIFAEIENRNEILKKMFYENAMRILDFEKGG